MINNKSFMELVEDLVKKIDANYKEPTKCPWYKQGFCRVDGKACPYSQDTYEAHCPTYDFADKHPEQINPVLDK